MFIKVVNVKNMKNSLKSQKNNEWGAVYARRGIAKGYKVAVKGTIGSVQKMPILKKSSRPIKYIHRIVYYKHPFVCFWQLLLPSHFFLCAVSSPCLINLNVCKILQFKNNYIRTSYLIDFKTYYQRFVMIEIGGELLLMLNSYILLM